MKKQGKYYYPDENFKKRAWVKNKKIYKQALKSPIKFWEKLAKEIYWHKKWKKVFSHNPPYFKWFLSGKLNITENCLDRNLERIRNKLALIWEPESTDERETVLTYYQLYRKVNKLANGLKRLGAKKGDKVGIYLFKIIIF